MEYKEIRLKSGEIALVDSEDYEMVLNYPWRFYDRYPTYSMSSYRDGKRVRKTVHMHNLIMDKKDGYFIDHINGNGLDNRKQNLRYVTSIQNSQNYRMDKSAGYTSKYKGVSYNKADKKWRARIRVNKKHLFLDLS